jgi:hypothetical protein
MAVPSSVEVDGTAEAPEIEREPPAQTLDALIPAASTRTADRRAEPDAAKGGDDRSEAAEGLGRSSSPRPNDGTCRSAAPAIRPRARSVAPSPTEVPALLLHAAGDGARSDPGRGPGRRGHRGRGLPATPSASSPRRALRPGPTRSESAHRSPTTVQFVASKLQAALATRLPGRAQGAGPISRSSPTSSFFARPQAARPVPTDLRRSWRPHNRPAG